MINVSDINKYMNLPADIRPVWIAISQAGREGEILWWKISIKSKIRFEIINSFKINIVTENLPGKTLCG